MKSNKKPVLSRRWTILILSVIGLLGLYTIIGFFVVPRVVQSVLPEKLSAATGRTVTLGSAAFNPFTFEMTLEAFAVLEKNEEPFASVGRLYVNAELLPLFTGKGVLKELAVDRPAVSVIRDRKGVFNFADLIPPQSDTPEKAAPGPESKMPAFLVKKASISAGKAAFKDQSAGSGFSLAVDPFTVTVENLGSREETPAAYTFEVATRSGARLKGRGTADIIALASEGEISLEGVPITQFEPYYRQFVKANIKTGSAAAGFTYRYPAGPESPLPAITDARAALEDLIVVGPKGAVRLINLPAFTIEGVALDPVKQVVSAASLRLTNAYVRADRDKSGGIYLLEAFIPPAADSQKPAPPDTPAETNPWKARLEEAVVEGLELILNENSARQPSVYRLGEVSVRAAGIEYDTGEMDGIPLVEEASVTLRDFKSSAADAEDAILAIPTLEVTGIRVDPFEALVTVASVITRQGSAAVQREADGRINVVESLPAIIAPPEKPSGPAQTEPAPAEENAAAPLTARIDEIEVADYTVSFKDLSTQTPALMYLDQIAIKAGNVSTAAGEKATLSTRMRWDKGGILSTNGALTLSPLAGKMKITAEKLEITPIQPYLNEKVHVLITGGDLNTTGNASFKIDPEKGFMASFKGNSLISKFKSLDKHLGKDFLRWKSLHFSGIDVDINPMRIALDEIALTDFYSRTTINKDGTINLQTVLAAEESGGQPPSAEAPAADSEIPAEKTPSADTDVTAESPVIPISIKAVTLQGGTVSFADLLIDPPFETEMLELGGNISGLSSEELARADVFLAGRLENHSPLKITGKINPLTRDRFSDVSIEFRDIDLSPFSPYTGKYIGYKLEKGLLTLILNYRLSQNTLVADNKIRFNRLRLGEEVESEDAVNLPVKLGLAILSDSEGNVELDLPVSGSLDDPEFSLGAIVFKAIAGLITKAVTAPFAALGNAFGGGAELSYIDFEAGQASLGEEQAETLTILANALAERPALNLEISGMVDPKVDGDELRKARYEELLQAQHARALYKGGQAPPEEARPDITEAQRNDYITRAYQEADIPKPRNADGSLKELPVDEMEKLLFTAITISPSDLAHLAGERAEAAKDHLIKDERLTADRLYITAPILGPPADGEEPLQPRVRFAIQK